MRCLAGRLLHRSGRQGCTGLQQGRVHMVGHLRRWGCRSIAAEVVGR